MKRKTILSALAVGLVMMGASGIASADHKDKNKRDRHKNEKTLRGHYHDDGQFCSVDHGTTRLVREPSVCSTAREQKHKVHRLQRRVNRLRNQYNHQVSYYGWRHARNTYWKMRRVQRKLHYAKSNMRYYRNQCQAMKRRHPNRRYSYSYSYNDRWSNYDYDYDYSVDYGADDGYRQSN